MRHGFFVLLPAIAVLTAPPPEDDCPSYRVTAQGAVDTVSQATIRDLRFELVCTH